MFVKSMQTAPSWPSTAWSRTLSKLCLEVSVPEPELGNAAVSIFAERLLQSHFAQYQAVGLGPGGRLALFSQLANHLFRNGRRSPFVLREDH
jgi:hypothetical protein